MVKQNFLRSDGFLYGWGLFETMQSYGGNVFALDEHLNRLFKSAKKIGFTIKRPKKTLENALKKAVKQKNSSRLYLRLNVWKENEGSNFNVIAKKYTAPSKLKYIKGFKAAISPFILNERSPLVSIKTLNYLFNKLIRKDAEIKGFDEAILLNSKGFIAEGAFSNIFLVKNNCLFTPALDCGILPGITRKLVIELAGKNKIKVKAAHLSLKDLKNADEAFLTNSLIQIMPLTVINKKSIHRKKIGPVTKKLMRAYARLTCATLSK